MGELVAVDASGLVAAFCGAMAGADLNLRLVDMSHCSLVVTGALSSLEGCGLRGCL